VPGGAEPRTPGSPGSAGDAPAIRLRGITKRFGAVIANDAVDLEVAPATIHGIVGENGAGKSTLMSVLSGFYQADAGEIEFFGEPVALASTADAIEKGIGMVHQHFMLVPNFTVVENVMLGAESGLLLKDSIAETRAHLLRLEREHHLEVDPDAIVGTLPVGLQQRVEILKALYRGGRILILDEPTGVLTPEETDRLFDILRGLKGEGVTILFITHKLREIMDVTDTVSVMRGGRMVAHRKTSETSREELAELMVGRKVKLTADHAPPRVGEPVLEVRGLGYRDAGGAPRLSDVTFDLFAGEILGVAGVSGNGQSELLAILSGITPPTAGSFSVGGREVSSARPTDPAEIRDLGVAHVPEDRRRQGLVLRYEARENAVLGYLDRPEAGEGAFLDLKRITRHCNALMSRYDVRPQNPYLRAEGFSGGNQQKIVIAREITAAPRVLLVGQPTRGVDIGAIEFIHRQLLALRDAGCAILLVSVELDEILALADRIVVLNAGRIVGTVPRAEAERYEIGMMMAGIAREAAA